MSVRQFFLGMVVASFLGGLLAIGGYQLFYDKDEPFTSFEEQQNVRLTNFVTDTNAYVVPEGLNFVHAAELVTPAVVHIRSTVSGSGATASRSPFEDMFRDYFGDRFGEGGQGRRSRSSGSGVIISSDGYIVTNNHVIDDADEIEVLLNDNRTYEAKVIGTDPTTDLALIKVDEGSLPFVKFGNSDRVRVGEWVLAVGNPFEFRSTVTAGIVSHKARNINILRDQGGMQIEAFIQTDAAVNPGNSGGALVDLNGNLIGINTAIATTTGAFAGYSFAVPVSLVKKVMDDLLEFGVVQRALLGVNIVDVNSDLAEENNLDILRGVFILRVNDGSAAQDAGIEEGDVITAVNGVEVSSVAELQEQIARKRPGDAVEVTYYRDGREKTTTAVLKNTMGNTNIVEARNTVTIENAVFEEVSEEEQEQLDIEGGVKIIELGSGKWKEAGVREGFIITSVDKRPISTTQELANLLRNKRGGTLIEGLYEDGEEAFYGIGF